MSQKKLGLEPTVDPTSRMTNSQLGIFTEVGPYNVLENVVLGDYSYTCQNCILQNVSVGKFANIAAHVRLGPTDHPMERVTQHHFTYRGPSYGLSQDTDEEFFLWRKNQQIQTGHDIWIGHGAIVMPGVKLGTGCVVGSGSVVTKDVAPYAVVVGVPAKVLKFRFEQSIIDRLLAIAWWDWDHKTLGDHYADFRLGAQAFLEKHESNVGK